MQQRQQQRLLLEAWAGAAEDCREGGCPYAAAVTVKRWRARKLRNGERSTPEPVARRERGSVCHPALVHNYPCLIQPAVRNPRRPAPNTQDLILELIKKNPNYKPPADWRPPRKTRKIYIPQVRPVRQRAFVGVTKASTRAAQPPALGPGSPHATL